MAQLEESRFQWSVVEAFKKFSNRGVLDEKTLNNALNNVNEALQMALNGMNCSTSTTPLNLSYKFAEDLCYAFSLEGDGTIGMISQPSRFIFNFWNKIYKFTPY